MKSFNQYLKEVLKPLEPAEEEGVPHQNAGKGGVLGGLFAGAAGNIMKHINNVGPYDPANTGTVSKRYKNAQQKKQDKLEDNNINRAQEFEDIKNSRAEKYEDIRNKTDDLKAQLSTKAISLADYQKAISDLQNETKSLRDAHRIEDAERRKEDNEIAAAARRTRRRTSGGSPAVT